MPADVDPLTLEVLLRYTNVVVRSAEVPLTNFKVPLYAKEPLINARVPLRYTEVPLMYRDVPLRYEVPLGGAEEALAIVVASMRYADGRYADGTSTAGALHDVQSIAVPEGPHVAHDGSHRLQSRRPCGHVHWLAAEHWVAHTLASAGPATSPSCTHVDDGHVQQRGRVLMVAGTVFGVLTAYVSAATVAVE